jgi:TonB family protein
MERKGKPMRPPIRLLITAGFTIFTALNAVAGDVKVIANPSLKVDTISTGELRSIFLLQWKALQDGSPVQPVLQKSGAAHEGFLKQYLNRDSEEIHIYYQGLVFTGKGSMPKELNSDAEVVAYVGQTKGAIGYVSSSANTDGVKVLVVVSKDRRGERLLLTQVAPEYPDTLERLRIAGTVRLQVTITAKGAVESISVLGGNPILGEAAVKAVKQWVYAPGPSRTTIQVTIPFEPRL